MTDQDQTVSWRELLRETTAGLASAGFEAASAEALWLIEDASGMEGAELVLGLDNPATVRGVAHLDAMAARRRQGEPIQYVLGHWSFRQLDLLCDERALIPRPETELVVEVALEALDRVVAPRPTGHEPVVVDLGTGTGAIALSIALERRSTLVWGVEKSPDALAVARANLAGLGMAGSTVRLVEGSWFDPLDASLREKIDLVVTNPPYVAAHEELAASVAEWEPAAALVPGPTGLEAYDEILAEVLVWLAPGGAVVFEIGASQAGPVGELMAAAGLVVERVVTDHAGLDRAILARSPAS